MIDFLTRRGKFFNPAWGVISSLTAKGVKAKVDNTFDGIYGNVTLSWSNATDRFYTSSIGSGSVTIAQGKAFTDGTNTVQFIGSYSPVALTPNDKSNLFLGTSTEDDQTVSTFYYPNAANNQDGNYYIYACRGYFHVDLKASSDSSEGEGSVRAFVLNFGDGEVSGITTTNYTNYTNFTDSDAWYSLDGRRLSSKPAKKGLYIHNGRKVAIK